MLNQRSAVVE
jgi:hypothetical protein